jgi:hypothetical protein
MKYVELDFGLRQNLCAMTLTQAVVKLGPSFVYDLWVSPAALHEARSLLRRLAADVEDNPLAPYVNLHLGPGMKPFEWFVTLPGKKIAFGSQGV